MSNTVHTADKLTPRIAKRPDNTGGFDVALVNESGQIVAECFEHVAHDGCGGYVKLPVTKYAALFAAAPAMLDALRAVLPYVQAGEAIVVRDAISRATGETP